MLCSNKTLSLCFQLCYIVLTESLTEFLIWTFPLLNLLPLTVPLRALMFIMTKKLMIGFFTSLLLPLPLMTMAILFSPLVVSSNIFVLLIPLCLRLLPLSSLILAAFLSLFMSTFLEVSYAS